VATSSAGPETLAAALTSGKHRLRETSDTAAMDAEVLLMHVLGRDRAHLRAWPEKQLTAAQTSVYAALIERRREGWPVAYLTGEREFWSRPFRVAPGVLIPRPETELLIELALAALPADHPADMLDLGTGSGIIAITLAVERPRSRVVAVDVSPEALAIAQENAERLSARNLRLLQGDWLTPLPPYERYDLIVSNPPYIAENDPHLRQGDLRHEPDLALASGADGLTALRRIIAEARDFLKPGGTLLLEHGYDQADAIGALLCGSGYGAITHYRDLQGHRRATMARYGRPSHTTPITAMPDTLQLPRALVNHLLHMAQIAPDGRMAGLIGATDGQARSFHATNVNNTNGSARKAAMKALQAQGETLLAILSSHPDSPAEPSDQEIADLEFPDTPHFIISLNTKGVLELRGFQRIRPSGWQEIELVLLED
jgi:release factor glutamine methyltransferase